MRFRCLHTGLIYTTDGSDGIAERGFHGLMQRHGSLREPHIVHFAVATDHLFLLGIGRSLENAKCSLVARVQASRMEGFSEVALI